MDSTDAPTSMLPVGDWQARMQLTARGVALSYVDPLGAPRARLARDVALRHRGEVAAVKARVADIERTLGEIRRRLEQSFRDGRDWSLADWTARYRAQPLARTLAARVIWRFRPGAGAPVDAMLAGDGLVTRDSATLPLPVSGRVRLWHPDDGVIGDTAAWRSFMLDRDLRQPFFQAWRPLYALTDPERRTATYSSRFAGLILEQPVLVRLLRDRSWRIHSRMLDCVPKHFAPARLDLPAAGLTAEYWGTGTGVVEERHDYGAPNFPYFATSQIRFYPTARIDDPARQPVALGDVPLRDFSEAMFDIDLVTGIATRGWMPDYADPGADALPPPPERSAVDTPFDADLHGLALDRLGESRRDLLAWLLPRLDVGARCRLEGHWLHVRGAWQHYAIHCGNAAVRIVESNRHLCIVPAATSRAARDLTLPIAGDDVLSLILSKAVLLADEAAIKDADILRQLR